MTAEMLLVVACLFSKGDLRYLATGESERSERERKRERERGGG